MKASYRSLYFGDGPRTDRKVRRPQTSGHVEYKSAIFKVSHHQCIFYANGTHVHARGYSITAPTPDSSTLLFTRPPDHAHSTPLFPPHSPERGHFTSPFTAPFFSGLQKLLGVQHVPGRRFLSCPVSFGEFTSESLYFVAVSCREAFVKFAIAYNVTCGR